MENKMNVKKLLVSFLMLVSVLFLAISVSAQVTDSSSVDVWVNGVNVLENPAVVVGETISIRVEFTATVSTSDVILRAELDGDRKIVEARTNPFDVEEGRRYVKTLVLEVPFDLRNKLSGFADLNIRISGLGVSTLTLSEELRVQRESFGLDILSVSVPQTVKSGDFLPVDVVLKNIGYNDLNDLFVTARISALDLGRTSFFGDLVAIECNKDASSTQNWGVDIERNCIERKVDTSSGRILLQLPFDAKPGIYALEVRVEGQDTVSSKTVQVVIENPFSQGNFIVSGNQLLVVNPTNQLVVYKLVPRSTEGVSVSLSEELVAVAAGSSRTIDFEATSSDRGTYTIQIDAFSADGRLAETVEFKRALEGTGATGPIVVLTVILAIIFIVLLVVLIILIGKKPKTEEFGESYY